MRILFVTGGRDFGKKPEERAEIEADAARRDELRKTREANNRWHGAINRFEAEFEARRFMYHAKDAAEEVVRLPALFRMEREGLLPKVHKQCSMSDPEPVVDNHLTCCLGVECRKCPQLQALDGLPPEEADRAKAWTCVAHILADGGNHDASEGYVLTTDDRMYWDRVYESLAMGLEEDRSSGTEK